MLWSGRLHQTKPLYVNLPDDVPEIEIQERADLLASRMGFLGVMESFSGPFRPHIMPNDEAEIISVDGTKYLGVITTVNHRLALICVLITDFLRVRHTFTPIYFGYTIQKTQPIQLWWFPLRQQSFSLCNP